MSARRVLQRDAAVHIRLWPCLFRATQTTRAANFDALCARLHRPLNGLFHRAAKGEATLELLGNTLRNQSTVRIRVGDFLHVHSNRPVNHTVEFATEYFNRFAAATDDDAWFLQCESSR